MELKPFGYILGDEFLIVRNRAMLIPLGDKKDAALCLRPTMFRLLIYLIENASDEPVADEDIMLNVWEKFGLRSSKARLWQVMNAMCKKISLMGDLSDVFIRVENTGYYVNKNKVGILFHHID